MPKRRKSSFWYFFQKKNKKKQETQSRYIKEFNDITLLEKEALKQKIKEEEVQRA